MKKWCSFLMALLMLLAASLGNAETVDYKQQYEEKIATLVENMHAYYEESGEMDKIAAYDEPVQVTSVNWYNAGMQDAMSIFSSKYGESYEDTRWTDLFKQLYNVDVEMKWWVSDDQYDQKLRLDMASGDIPDIFIVRKQEDLMSLVEADMIWDLSELYEQWGSEMDKANWESDGGHLLTMATFDDKLYGLPAGLSDTDLFSYIWLRDDWMKELNLAYPTTLEELKGVMDAFRAADFDGNGVADTIGLGLDKTLYYTTRGIFAAYQSYPEFWIEDGDQVVWGGVTDSTKNALAFLAELYAEGYIDKEFITKSETDMLESALSGRCGVQYGGHWLGMTWGDLHETDPDSNWVCIPLPTVNAGDEPVKQCLQPYGHGWVVVSKACEHPEIAFKMFAAADFSWYGEDSGWWIYDENNAWPFCPVHVCCSAWENINAWRDIQQVYQTNDPSQLHFNGLAYWEKLNGEFGWEWALMFGNSAEQDGVAMKIASDALDNGQLFYESFLGPQSAFMQDRWSTIKDEQLIAFTKIIIGETSVEEGFSNWLTTFSNLGGDQITQEVNDWCNAQK